MVFLQVVTTIQSKLEQILEIPIQLSVRRSDIEGDFLKDDADKVSTIAKKNNKLICGINLGDTAITFGLWMKQCKIRYNFDQKFSFHPFSLMNQELSHML